MSFIPVAPCSLQNSLEIFESLQCVLGFSSGSGQLVTPRKPPREGKSTDFSRRKERPLSAQYEKRWSSQITYCCSQCSRRGHAPVKPKEQCPKIAKDATLMSQSCRLSGPHLHRLHPVHNKTHKKERQQGVPLWESTAHTEPAWFNAKIVNRALVPNALNAE